MKKFSLQLTLLLCTLISVSSLCYGQQHDSYTQSLIDKFLSYYKDGVDEKLYLQTDKPYYSAGEKVWIKGYLLNSITHAPLRVTNFIYVELIDSSNRLMRRTKIQRDSTGFNGYLELASDMPAADYSLRGYTRWMSNKSEELFFHKDIKVVSPIPESAAEERTGSDLPAGKDLSQSPEGGELVDAEPLDFDIQFFPEGGALIAGIPQRVAFKAVAKDGLSTEITGTIFDSEQKPVAKIASSHNGMGVMQVFADKSKSYRATITSSEGKVKEFALPTPADDAVIIKVQRMGERVFYQVEATNNALLAGAHVVVHSRGKILIADSGALPATRFISLDMLYDGISVFAVVDSNNNVLSERLFFKRPEALPSLDIATNAENYAARSKAKVNITVKDSEGLPAKGEFAVSVTDNSAVEFEDGMESSLSYLLLSSELKGHIESPGLYFTAPAAEAEANLDILMMTQGWRRFDLQDIINGVTPQRKEGFEDVAKISGRVRGFFGNAARRPKLFVLCSQINYTDIFSLDESSRFNLLGLNIPDSVTYIIQGQGRNGGSTLKLMIDPEHFPALGRRRVVAAERNVVPFEFINQSQEKFYYEGGLTNVDLDAISVTTTKQKSVAGVVGAGISTQGTSREELEQLAGVSLEQLVLSYPSMLIESDSVFYRGSNNPVTFTVNGMDDEYGNLTYLTSDDIERLDFFAGADAAAFSDADGGVMCITLREGVSLSGNTQSPNIAFVSQLGYQSRVEFYQPKYDNPSIKANWPPDYRTTVYWNGSLLSDESGTVGFDFFTADKATSYTITVEGVTDSGEICHARSTIERTAAR